MLRVSLTDSAPINTHELIFISLLHFILLTMSAISSVLFWFIGPCFKSYLSYKFGRPGIIHDRAKMNLAGHRVWRLSCDYFEPCGLSSYNKHAMHRPMENSFNYEFLPLPVVLSISL